MLRGGGCMASEPAQQSYRIGAMEGNRQMTRTITIDLDQAERMIHYKPDVPEHITPHDMQVAALCLLEHSRTIMSGGFYEHWRRMQPDEVRLFEAALEFLTRLVRPEESWS